MAVKDRLGVVHESTHNGSMPSGSTKGSREQTTVREDLILAEDDVEVVIEDGTSLSPYETEVVNLLSNVTRAHVKVHEILTLIDEIEGLFKGRQASADLAESRRLEEKVLIVDEAIRSKVQDARRSINVFKDLKCSKALTPENPPAYYRIRDFQERALLFRLNLLVKRFFTSHADHQDELRRILTRHLKYADKARDLTDEDISQIIDNGNFEAVYDVEGILTTKQEYQLQLDQAKEQRDSLLALEKQIEQIRDLFFQVASLVEEQGEMINSIERNIMDTTDHIAAARVETHKALSNQKKARKKKIICFTIIGVAVGIIVLIIIISIATSVNKNNDTTA